MSLEPTAAPPQKGNHSNLEELESSADDRPPFVLTYAEVKLLGIAGVGFFLDGKCIPNRLDVQFD